MSKILKVLSMAQMGKFFSQFGVRTLLVLYLVQELHYSDSHAFGVNAVFCGLCELSGVFGGLIADRWLGLKRGMILGGWLLTLGYSLLIYQCSFYLSMGIIIAGSSLFSGNLTALIGRAYDGYEKERRKSFTFFYMLQNFGALLSTLVCGYIAVRFGFLFAFALSSIGMLFSNLLLFFYRRELIILKEGVLLPTKRWLLSFFLSGVIFAIGTLALLAEKKVLLFLPWISAFILFVYIFQLLKDKVAPKNQVYILIICLFSIILFYAVEDQICSSLLLFSERESSRNIFGWVIPSSFITLANPLIIILFGSLIAKRCPKLILPFILTGGSFGILALFCFLNLNFSIFGVMGVVAIISLAELMIGPFVLTKTSEIASKGSPGMIMGMVPIAFSLAYQLSGGLSKLLAAEKNSFSLKMYNHGFLVIAFLMIFGGVVLNFLMRKFTYEKKSLTESD